MRSALRFETFTFAVFVVAVAGCVASGAGQGGDAGGGAGSVMMMPGGSGGGTAGSGSAGSGACTSPPTARLAWTIGYSGTGPAVSCAQAAATTLQLFMNSTPTQFTCNAQSGVSVGLMPSAALSPPGSYTPRVLLTNAQGGVLAQGDLSEVTIPSCGVTDLGNIRFVVDENAGAAGAGAGGASGAAGMGGAAGASGAAGAGGPCNALPIFAMHQCSYKNACHDSSGSAAGFDMQTSGWEKTLVGRTPKAGGGNGLGSQCLTAGMPYLVAGSAPARGLFLDKLTKARPECGEQMPLLPPLLTAQELDCVQRWANGLVSGK
jgi:hypothetical protein